MSSKAKNSERELTIYRWEVLGRVLIAVFGGYIFSIGTALLLTHILPFDRSSLVMTADLLTFALYTTAIIWVFSVKRFRTLWLGLAGSLAVLALARFVFSQVNL